MSDEIEKLKARVADWLANGGDKLLREVMARAQEDSERFKLDVRVTREMLDREITI